MSYSNSTRCAACKFLRRRCSKDCILAPYFPSNDPDRFSCVHKIFGASSVTKNLERVPSPSRSEAADCMTFEANARIEDPVYGCSGIISQLQQQFIDAQREIELIQGEIVIHNAQELFPLQSQEQPSWFNQLIPNEFEELEQLEVDGQEELANFK